MIRGKRTFRVVSWEKTERKGILIYEGVASDPEGGERVRFHFTVREDLLIGDFQSETVGVYPFLDEVTAELGKPEREPYAIFLGEFGDGEPAIPVTVWWRMSFEEGRAWVEKFIRERSAQREDG
ncbi:MAG: hypothetical protein D6713_01405 [Deltaproteobacteria bacterium]|nr:MAG: hypothetical protein D6713_01405 [Deltaproteobacteria bacterium]